MWILILIEIFYFIHTFQKPILLHGHERSITQIKYNREGDLIFSCAKDSQPNVWYSLNGERLGSFRGHNGAVWNIDVNCILCYYKIIMILQSSFYIKKIFFKYVGVQIEYGKNGSPRLLDSRWTEILKIFC